MIFIEAKLDELNDEDDDENNEDDDRMSSTKSTENQLQNEKRQHRCIKQMGKLAKVNGSIEFLLPNIIYQ